jgi:hypothetical protein
VTADLRLKLAAKGARPDNAEDSHDGDRVAGMGSRRSAMSPSQTGRLHVQALNSV